jgi:Protein of unknown function (DUF3710)
MALGRRTRRSERAKLDATPPWEERVREAAPPTTGPWDERDVPDDGVARLDLGALRVPIVEGLEVTVGLDAQGQPVEVALRHGGSEMRLVALAAPRSGGIWDEVRKQLRGSLAGQGGTAQDSRGRFGTELTARAPVHGGYQTVRFVGVDGPRWMLQATFAGPAATDPGRAAALEEILRGVVVVRGTGPMPVRDPLVLTLPRQEELVAEAHPAPGGEVAEGPLDAGLPVVGQREGAEPAGGQPAGAGEGRREPGQAAGRSRGGSHRSRRRR